jgi:hypothetical protein
MNYIQKAARYLELQRDLASAINDTKTERKCDAALIELKIDPDLSAAAASKLKVRDKVPLRRRRNRKLFGYFCPTPQKGKIRGLQDGFITLRGCITEAETDFSSQFHFLEFQRPPRLSRTGIPLRNENAPISYR